MLVCGVHCHIGVGNTEHLNEHLEESHQQYRCPKLGMVAHCFDPYSWGRGTGNSRSSLAT